MYVHWACLMRLQYMEEDGMNVLAQALNVAEQAEAAGGVATLTFDLRKESHRAAYAAALAVLRISGVDEESLLESAAVPGEDAPPLASSRQAPDVTASEPDAVPDTPYVAELRKRYLDALTDLTPDAERREQATRETFPRVVELLRDGANVEAVAQIQYRRWVEENLDTVRS